MVKSLAGSQHASQARHVHSTDISDDATGQPKGVSLRTYPSCPEGGGRLTAPAFPRAIGRKSRRWPIGCSIRTPARCAPATRAAQAKGAEVAEAATIYFPVFDSSHAHGESRVSTLTSPRRFPRLGRDIVTVTTRFRIYSARSHRHLTISRASRQSLDRHGHDAFK